MHTNISRVFENRNAASHYMTPCILHKPGALFFFPRFPLYTVSLTSQYNFLLLQEFPWPVFFTKVVWGLEDGYLILEFWQDSWLTRSGAVDFAGNSIEKGDWKLMIFCFWVNASKDKEPLSLPSPFLSFCATGLLIFLLFQLIFARQ